MRRLAQHHGKSLILTSEALVDPQQYESVSVGGMIDPRFVPSPILKST